MKVLIVDNYDSFTYNIEHYVRDYADVEVVKIDNQELYDKINNYHKIILSPGPGLPKDRREVLQYVINHCIDTNKPLLGVCYGHQAIAEFFGAKLYNLKQVFHGLALKTIIIDNDLIFNYLPKQFMSGRYHSWAVSKENFPENILTITSIDENDVIMSLKHNTLNIRGVQFHPESVLTENGKKIIENWVTIN